MYGQITRLECLPHLAPRHAAHIQKQSKKKITSPTKTEMYSKQSCSLRGLAPLRDAIQPHALDFFFFFFLLFFSYSPTVTSKYPGVLPFSPFCLPGLKSILGLASPAPIFLIAWKVACSLVWPVLLVLPLPPEGVAGVPPLLCSRFSTPLQLVARLSVGAVLLLATDKCGGGLLACCATRGRSATNSLLGLTMGLSVGSANSNMTCDPLCDSYMFGCSVGCCGTRSGESWTLW